MVFAATTRATGPPGGQMHWFAHKVTENNQDITATITQFSISFYYVNAIQKIRSIFRVGGLSHNMQLISIIIILRVWQCNIMLSKAGIITLFFKRTNSSKSVRFSPVLVGRVIP